MATRGEGWGEGIVREFGIDMYTLLYLRCITNKDPIIAQGTILKITYKEKESGKEYIYSFIYHCAVSCTPETNLTL